VSANFDYRSGVPSAWQVLFQGGTTIPSITLKRSVAWVAALPEHSRHGRWSSEGVRPFKALTALPSVTSGRCLLVRPRLSRDQEAPSVSSSFLSYPERLARPRSSLTRLAVGPEAHILTKPLLK
jgi:hypothetical protein